MPRDPGDVAVGAPVDEPFFEREARTVARDLVGALLLHEGDDGGRPVGGLVVETEAYVNAADPACHLTAGRTARTEAFFSGPGTVYVYVLHGHAALNVITATDGHPEGVLVRALEPTHGRDVMRERRGFDDPELLAAGPGRLTEALGVTKALTDRPLADTPLALHATDWTPDVDVTARVGVTSAEDWPLRYVAADDDYVSQPAPDVALDWRAVEDAYDALHADAADYPTVDAEQSGF